MASLPSGCRSGIRLRCLRRTRADRRRGRALARPGGRTGTAAGIAEQALSAGIRQISLSVERKNFAQQLYLSEGYQIVDSSGKDSDTMVKNLTPRIGDT
jgi:hypothetical protein